MIKKLDLYILKRFLSRVLFLIIAITSIIILTNFVETIDDFIEAGLSNGQIVDYYLLFLPMIISYAVPMAMTIGSVLLVLSYIKNNELIAIRSLGVNYFRFSVIMVLFSIIISIAHFYFENSIVSNSNHLKNKFEKKYGINVKKNKQNNKKITNFIEDLESNKSIIINSYNNKEKIANNVIIREINTDNNITNRYDAKELKWNENLQKWDCSELIYRNWQDDNFNFQKTIKDTSVFLNNITPVYLIAELISPEEMNYFELKEFIDIKKKNSIDTTNWEVDLHHKVSYIFSSIILTIAAIIVSLIFKNSNTSYGIGLSIVIIALYYTILIISKNLGLEGVLDPISSAWMANISFTFIILFFYKKYIF